MMKKPWTKSDETFLCENYRSTSHKELMETLGRTLPSIVGKARELGLVKYHKKRVQWTEEEIKILQTEYGYRKKSISALAKRFGKSVSSLNKKAYRLGLTKRLNEETPCPQCGRNFIVKYANQVFCSKSCRNKYKWRLVRKEWGNSGHLTDASEFVIKSERFVIEKVLPVQGFTNIIHTREKYGHFIFDILCMKDGRKCGIQVTMYPSWCLKKDLVSIVEFLELHLFCCHVKPDLSDYVLNEINLKDKRSSSIGIR